MTAVREVGTTPCQENDADLWFDPAPGAIAQARRLCTRCLAQGECLRAAIARGEPWGVWGGELFADGRPVGVRRYPGRPRKDRDAIEAEQAAALAARLARLGAA